MMVEAGQIRAARAMLGWTQEQLAERAKISRRLVIAVEAGQAVVGNGITAAVVDALKAAGIAFFVDAERRGVSLPTAATRYPV
jgi:transcriptional regulator with XRE-family HTH domain